MSLTLDQYLALPNSKKITLLEVDSPLDVIWLNYSPGRWFSVLSPGTKTDTDDKGNVAYWGSQNTEYYNIGSLSVMGELYTEAASFAAWEVGSTKLWFYDEDTAIIYLTIDNYDPPRSVLIIKPGAILGFTNGVDQISNGNYAGIPYEPLIKALPTLSKRKDPLFFGIISYQGGGVSLENLGGELDDMTNRGLYGQPLRVRLTFEGQPYAESLIVYTARVGKIIRTWQRLNISIADPRSFLTRKLPVNTFSKTDSTSPFYFPSIDDKLDGIPVPISFAPVIKAPAYKTSSGNWTFADDTFNPIDAGIVVYKEDDSIITHGGTETDGTFTISITAWNSGTAYSIGDYVYHDDGNSYEAIKAGTNQEPPNSEYWIKFQDDKLTVSFTQSTVDNGLDVISFILENYENIPFDALRYDLTEWNAEKVNVKDLGLWIGQGNLIDSIAVITKVCKDNQGIFDVLADGRFTFRKLDVDKDPSAEILLDELLDEPKDTNDPTEVLSSVKIEYSEDIKEKIFEIYTNTDFEEGVYAQFETYRERIFRTNITSQADAVLLSEDIMALSKTIFPDIDLNTKTQYIQLRILDIILYTYERINGKILIPRSRYQVLSLVFDLMNYEVTFGIKQIREDDNEYVI